MMSTYKHKTESVRNDKVLCFNESECHVLMRAYGSDLTIAKLREILMDNAHVRILEKTFAMPDPMASPGDPQMGQF